VTDCLVDTNILIDLLHNIPKAVQWQAAMNGTRMGITAIIWFEVVQGAQNKVELQRALKFLARFDIEHTQPSDETWAMQQFARLRLSHGVEFQDVLIAAVAQRLSVMLYTRNPRHFTALPNLNIQQPY
jgi:predicted nucleic acid-binding protein